MPTFTIPNAVSIHTSRNFLTKNRDLFSESPGPAILDLHPQLSHLDPLALTMVAAWGARCRRLGLNIEARNLSRHCNYAARMHLFDSLNLEYQSNRTEHEESGRFIPIRRVQNHNDIRNVIGETSALLHLHDEPDSLAAVQYCVSELIRNVLEHSGSEDGAFVCAQRYEKSKVRRLTIAVADCGVGIAKHLGEAKPEIAQDHSLALGYAMQPGVTGAKAGIYGTPDNAGAGLFVTRCIAKGTGGYFLLVSGDAAYRLRRSDDDQSQLQIFADPYDEERYDRWAGLGHWEGTAVTVEIRTDKVGDFPGLFEWIKSKIPSRSPVPHKIKFT